MPKIIYTTDVATMANLSPNETDWVYNGLDCTVTAEVLEALLKNQDEVSEKTYKFSLALQAPVLEMSLRGILIDTNERDRLIAKALSNIGQLSTQLNTIFRDGLKLKINWRSPKQLGSFLYDVMGLKEIKKRSTTTGKYSRTVGRDALEKLQYNYYAQPICKHLLTLRDYDKQRQFLEAPIDKDQVFRSGYNIAGTNTGRLSSAKNCFGTGNNAQNVSRDLRSICRSRPGYKFANLDLEQADARNIGAICWNLFIEDHGPEFAGAYLDACESGDLHTQVCKLAWQDLNWPDNYKGQRKIADEIFYRNYTRRDASKTLGHGTNYIGQPATMAKHSHIPAAIITEFQKQYFGAFPCIPMWHEYVKYCLKHHGFITTLFFNRRRFFFGRPTEDATVREAVAYAPQSMTADEIDTGIIKLWETNKIRVLAQVHDNILFEYPEEREAEIIPWALKTLEVPMMLKQGREFIVPTEAKIGWNWGDTSFNSDGSVKSNPHGLVKWKGSVDIRNTPIYNDKKKPSIWNF